MVGNESIHYKHGKSIPQGSCLSPFLFNRADYQVVSHAESLFRYSGISAKIVGYADDHVIVTTVREAQRAVNCFKTAVDLFGFVFEASKPKCG